MANRRQFIQSGLALTAVSLPGISTWAAGVGATKLAALRLERFVFDNRFAEAVEVARHAARRHVPLAEISGDLTGLWYNDLDLRWRQRPMALAGVTTQHGLFVLETLAADRGMRVVYRGEHGVPQHGRVAHVFLGPEDLVAQTASASSASVWAPLGRCMTECRLGRRAVTRFEMSTPAESTQRETPLLSWIIAPRASLAPLA